MTAPLSDPADFRIWNSINSGTVFRQIVESAVVQIRETVTRSLPTKGAPNNRYRVIWEQLDVEFGLGDHFHPILRSPERLKEPAWPGLWHQRDGHDGIEQAPLNRALVATGRWTIPIRDSISDYVADALDDTIDGYDDDVSVNTDFLLQHEQRLPMETWGPKVRQATTPQLRFINFIQGPLNGALTDDLLSPKPLDLGSRSANLQDIDDDCAITVWGRSQHSLNLLLGMGADRLIREVLFKGIAFNEHE